MSYWTILSCCFSTKTSQEDIVRPRGLVNLNGKPVSALFDTGSAISLVDSKYLDLIRTGQVRGPSIRLCGANGSPLLNKGTYEIKITVKNRTFVQPVHFIENLQVPCILGMDFMKRAKLTIDIGNKCIRMGRPVTNNNKVLFLNKDIALDPNSEKQVDLQVPWTFDVGLVKGVHLLPDQIAVMDGVCKGTVRNGKPVCPVIIANFSHLTVKLSAYSPLAKVSRSSDLQMFSLQDCLTVTNGRPQLKKIDHIVNIDLSRLPEHYQPSCKSLLRANADVFSRNDLDVGHCKSLPHKVRLKDPNRITAINQNRLPYHLKEVAIDYVK